GAMATTTRTKPQDKPYSPSTTNRFKGVSPRRPKRRDALAPDLAGVTSATGTHPNFGYQGGPIINTPQVHALFVGDWASAANQARAARLQQFVSDMLNSRYMNILSQYGCGTSGSLAGSAFVAAPDADLSGAEIHA